MTMRGRLCTLAGIYTPVVSFLVETAWAQQAYCFDQQCVDCVNPAPRLCPPENIFTYYDCCIGGCCQFVKWPNLIFLIVVIFALLAGCVCCCFFLVSEANQRKDNRNHSSHHSPTRRSKKSIRRQTQDNPISTIEQAQPHLTPTPAPRYSENRRSTVV